MKIETALQHLGLTTTATEADVKQAYRELVKIWHPDRFQNDERLNSRTEAQLKIINEAKTVALAYLERYGHFLKVGQERPRTYAGPGGPGRQYRKPPPKEDAEPKQQKKEEPRPEPEPEPEKEEKAQAPRPAGPSFQFGQNTLIVVFILLVLVSFLILLTTTLRESPMERMKAFTEQPMEVDPLRKIMAEKEARERKALGLEEADEDQTAAPADAEVDTFFTLGSDKEWVSEVQGPPLQIQSGVWRYGFSTIEFEDNLVVGWNSSDMNPLKVGMLPDPDRLYSDYYFGIGSTKDEVVALQGTPSIIQGNDWHYGEALVQFQADTVTYWENDRLLRLQTR